MWRVQQELRKDLKTILDEKLARMEKDIAEIGEATQACLRGKCGIRCLPRKSRLGYPYNVFCFKRYL